MPRRLPQLNALKAFEAAARHVSFTRAAEELCVTQGAISHQVKALEAELGVKLFNLGGSQRHIPKSTFAYRPRCTTSTSRAKMSTSRYVTATAIGQDCM
jgi:hypothetical protein